MRKRWIRWGVLGGLLMVGAALTLRAFWPEESAVVQARLIGAGVPSQAFERVDGPRAVAFPRDHGPHPEFQTEWWYYTGNLDSEDGRHFGYQLTFFRRAAAAPAGLTARESTWAVEQVYMAHFALTDVAGRSFQSFEKLSRGAAGLAGASGEPAFEVWLEDWQVHQLSEDTYRLQAAQNQLALDLTLRDLKGPILQGDQGYSQKGPERGNASTYYSQTRLETTGVVRIDGSQYPVNGTSWMDHEVSTSALSAGQVGWDWFSFQLSDGSELMLFNLRRADGGVDPYSSGSLVGADGRVVRLSRDDFEIRATGEWRSPRSGAVYPSGWEIHVAESGLVLSVDAYLPDQEHALSYAYWEGAVKVEGERGGTPVSGVGYAELTGYADSMAGDF